MIKNYWIVAIAFISFSCQRTIYFTEDLRKIVEENKLDLKKIQFYNSLEVSLRRDVSSEEAKIAKGKITISNGKYIEEIVLKKETKGICKTYDAKSLNVGFEEGDHKQLNFSRAGDYYIISTKKSNSNLLNYDLKEYELMKGTGCKLKVKKSLFRKFQKNVRTLKGLEVE